MSNTERTVFSCTPATLQLISHTCKVLVLPVGIQQSVNTTEMLGTLLADITSSLPADSPVAYCHSSSLSHPSTLGFSSNKTGVGCVPTFPSWSPQGASSLAGNSQDFSCMLHISAAHKQRGEKRIKVHYHSVKNSSWHLSAACGINQQCPGLASLSLSHFNLSNSWQFNNIFLVSSRSYSLAIHYNKSILAFPAQACNGIPSSYDRRIMCVTLSVYSVCVDGGDQHEVAWPCWAAGLTGCWGAPGSSFAVARMEQVGWLPGEREPSEGDFLPDAPAERRTEVAFYIQKLVQHFIGDGAKLMCFEIVCDR